MMASNRFIGPLLLSTGLSAALFAIPTGCGSSTADSAPAQINPEMEKKTQDMMKNLSKDYGDMYRKKAGR